MNVIDANKLTELAAALAAAGYRVVAPRRDGEVVRLADWAPGAAIELDQVPVNSAKDFVFVPSELIGRYTRAGDEFTQEEVRPEAKPLVLLGVRPCDAAALAAMDAVFNWDSKDEFYLARRRATVIITFACVTADENCFCTSVGGGPDSTRGADAMLRFAEQGGRFIIEPLSDKGHEVLKFARKIAVEGEAKADPLAKVPVKFDRQKVTDWLAKGENFTSPQWLKWSLACMGCAACAYACPTCHCFDIQDEATRSGGVRYRNWDACGLAQFTLHTSGHNPRPDQTARWRQRVMHKFSYYVDKFGQVACTGCGRCARLCPAGMAVLETVKAIAAEK